ncbi:hypothetical protein FPV67DRAFT_641933 [Lyophyllum atratum]|nr:hypothetical protein FPV67DRAFT_641933 [Lyophyllum atratum]
MRDTLYGTRQDRSATLVHRNIRPLRVIREPEMNRLVQVRIQWLRLGRREGLDQLVNIPSPLPLALPSSSVEASTFFLLFAFGFAATRSFGPLATGGTATSGTSLEGVSWIFHGASDPGGVVLDMCGRAGGHNVHSTGRVLREQGDWQRRRTHG